MAIPDQQAEVAAFLRRLAGADPVETHISAVFVGGDDAYKLKKAVRLPFLDFTDAGTRHDMIRREYALNRIAAPDIYKSVHAVARAADGTLRLADEEAPGAIDYVLRMARVPDADFMDAIVRRGALTPSLQDALGDAVADLHARCPQVRDWNSSAGMRDIIAGNVAAARAAGLPGDAVALWERDVLRALAPDATLLDARAASGHVRRAHGDLHLGNICLRNGVPTAFDMLEFDDALATIDVGYDLAFLLMDLEIRAGRKAANRVMNRYLARTGDSGMLPFLPCFLSVRAVVRAHVQASRGQAADAARYLAFARELLEPVRPMLLAIGGLQGAGKTTLARALAPDLGRAPGAFLLRSDEVRKRLFGCAPEAKLPEPAYAPGANARVNIALTEQAGTGLRAGQAVVVDSTFLHAPLRSAVEAVARTAHVPFLGLWLEADFDTALDRLARRAGDASDAGPEVLRRAAQTDAGGITWHIVRADDADHALGEARRLLAELPVGRRSAAPRETAQIEPEGRTGNGHDGD